MELRCAIVDDEPLAITVLEGMLEKIPGINVIATFNDALSAMDYLADGSNEVDFLFLDIEMPSLSGIDFLKTLTSPPPVIISSANKNYAIEGFELNVVDYVLKPITFERIVKSINKIKERFDKEVQASDESPEALFLKENKKMVKVVVGNILYIEGVKDYVKVVTNRKMVITKNKISYFEEILPSDHFIRVHKSFIVAVNHIDAYSSSFIEIGFNEIPVGRSYKDSALKKLGKISESE